MFRSHPEVKVLKLIVSYFKIEILNVTLIDKLTKAIIIVRRC